MLCASLRAAAAGPRRGLASSSAAGAVSPPLMWKWAHGMFEAETPMATPLAGLDAPTVIDPAHPGPVSVTALANGVRVASQDLGGPVTALGVFVGAGSRHETTYTAGSTHVLEHLAFKGSAARSKFRMIRDVERTGAMFSAAASRESIAFSAETLPRHAPEVVSILAECATKPAVAVTAYGTPEWDSATAEIAEHVVAIKNELKEFSADPSGQVTEAMHAAAYHGNTLGLPLIAEQRKLDAITPGSIAEFISGAFSADRIVIAGSNIPHEELVRLAEVSLGDFASTGSAVTVPSQYTGGSVSIPGDGPGHFAIGFEGVSWADDDLVPVCVLHTLLGGGGSFSSGGPGKGMYTRLFSEILNRREWVSSAIAFNHCYSDTGLFGIHASCQDPANLNNLIEVVTEQAGKMANALGSDELERAKNMTKSSLIMNLESRAVVCEDIGRQILGSGKYVGPEQLVGAIDAVDEGAIRRVARRMLVSKPSIVMHGEEYATHAFDQIESSVKALSKIAA